MEPLFSADIISSIGSFLTNFPLIGVLAMIAIFIVRGELATLFSVYLIQMGYMGWTKLILIGFFSVMLSDIILYYIGKHGKDTKIISYIEKKVKSADKLEKFLHNHTKKALILTKFTMGLGSVTIVLSGWSKINFKRFLKINTLANALWFGFIIILSFILIQVLGFIGAKNAFDYIVIIVGVGIIFIFLLEYIARKIFEKESEIEN